MRADAGQIAASAAEMAVAAVVGAIPVARGAPAAPGRAGPGRTAPGWAGPLLRGVLVAAPLLLVFVALFAAADAVFAAAAGRVLALPFDLPIAEMAERGAAVAVVAWVAAGVLVVAAGLWVMVRPPAGAGRLRPAIGTPPIREGGRRASPAPRAPAGSTVRAASGSATWRPSSSCVPGGPALRRLRRAPGRLPVRRPRHAGRRAA